MERQLSETSEALPRIGRYEVVKPIGSGGMAEVFEVADLLTREHHALKLLVDNNGRQLFDREYEVMNRLNDPGVVRTYSYGLHRDMPWMSMELLYGVPAQTYVKRVGKPGAERRTQEVIRIGGLAARALHYAHGQGIVHRDVKSGNIILLPDQRVKLVDFGISYLSDGENNTIDGEFVGTPGYASPEQIRGDLLDARADVYALGVLLYRLCTGRAPFRQKDVGELLRAHLSSPRPHPSELIPHLPKRMADLIFEMMSIEPSDRPRHAGAVAERLDALIGNTILPGTELAIHAEVADGRERIRRQVMGSDHNPLVVIVGDDERDRLRILQRLVEEAREDSARAGATVLRKGRAKAEIAKLTLQVLGGVMDRDPVAMRVKRAAEGDRADAADLGDLLVRGSAKHPGGIFLAFQLAEVDKTALDLLGELAKAVKRAGVRVRFILGCADAVARKDQPVATQLSKAEFVPIPALTPHETALAVGFMLGRRPPAGALAKRIYEVTAGWPTAVEDVVQDLVTTGVVEAEGDQILWARYALEIPVPEALRVVLAESLDNCTKRERHILNAVAFMEGATYEALDAHIPHSEGVLEKVISSLTHKGLLRQDGDLLKPGTRTLGVVLRREIRGSSRVALKMLLSRKADKLPPSVFRVRALVSAGHINSALKDALALAQAMVDEGRWKEASAILEEVYNETANLTVTTGLAQLLLLYAKCGLATGRRDIATAQALTAVRRFVSDESILAQCDLMDAELQRSIGHYANYRMRVSKGVERAAAADDPVIQARLSFALGRGHLWLGNLYDADKTFNNARETLAEGDQVLLARILAGRARCAYGRGELLDAEEIADEAIQRAGNDPVALSDGLRVWADVRRRQGRFSEALERLREAVVTVRTFEDLRPYTQLLVGIAWCEADLHRLGLAQECLDELASVIREGELLHIRLERTVLNGHVRMLSGQPRIAEFLLQSARNSAKKAGLSLLAAQARTYMISAQHQTGSLREPVDDWFRSRRISYLADRHLWTFVDASIAYLNMAAPTVDPDEIFAPAMGAIKDQNALAVEVEMNLARARYQRATGKTKDTLITCRDVTRQVATISKHLADTERSALRVHPWPRRVRAVLKGGL